MNNDLNNMTNWNYDDWQKYIKQMIFEASINLEKTELIKNNTKEFIEKVLNDNRLSYKDKFNYFSQAWKIYIDYDKNIMPLAIENLNDCKKMLEDLRKLNS